MKREILICFFLVIHSFLYGQLSGTYTIGGINPDYSTIAQAQTALQNEALIGPVIFNIRDGIYVESISLNGNAIFGNSLTNSITFQSESQNPAAVIIEQSIYPALDIDFSIGVIINNLTFNGATRISYSTNCKFTNNISLSKSFTLSYSDSCIVAKNIFHAGFSHSFSNSDTIVNNFIHKYLRNSFSNNNVIAFNNLSSDPTTYFSHGGANCLIVNNNMPANFYVSFIPNTIINNNYPLGGGQFDSLPFFVDPQYLSPTDLHSTNPQLLGTGQYYTEFFDDIDNIVRTNPTTIGANEICIPSNFVNSYCGDSITLSLCNMPAGNNFLWSPAAGLNDPHKARPKVSSTISQWYYVTDTIISYSDSVFLNVIPFNVYAGSDDSILVCGKNVTLLATYNANASYQWIPIDSLSNPNSFNTVANPVQSTQYIVSATVPGCPPSFDSVMVFVNPLPVVQVSLASQNHNNICFLNNSDCADTYLWDFGDSTFSSDANPCHVYPDTGLFLVTLIACNSFGCDTFQRYIFVDSILISSLEDNNYSEEFEIFPNPANNNFTIKFNPIFETAPIEIYNTYGACVYTSSVSGNCKSINFNLPTGVYIVRLIANKRMISRRIVIF